MKSRKQQINHKNIIIIEQKAVTINYNLWQEINIMLGFCLGAFGTMSTIDYSDDKEFIQKKCAETTSKLETLLDKFTYE